MSQHVIVIRSTYLSRRTTDYVIYDPPMNPHDEQRFGRVTLVGLIIAIFGVAFMFGGHPVISALLLLLAWVLVVLDEDMRSGTR